MYFLQSFVCVALIAIFGQSEGIFNGRETEPNEFPFVVWFRIGKIRVHCGGSLIRSDMVLTTASCVLDNNMDDVILGDHQRSVNEGTEQEFSINETFVHPDYNSTTNENDLAIVRLSGEADLSGSAVAVGPVLYKNDELVDRVMAKHCRVVGWGSVVETDTNLVFDQSDILLYYVADVEDDAICEAAGAPSSSFCYTPYHRPRATSVTCNGDVGGAVMCKKRRVWNIVGVITDFNTGISCTQGVKAAMKLTNFTAWIRLILQS